MTHFEEPGVRERERRHSIERESDIRESELYASARTKPPPLFQGTYRIVIFFLA